MNKEDTKQAILGFTEFFKGITGNQDLKIPDDIAKKYEIESNKWIPVSERLPEVMDGSNGECSDDVLICVADDEQITISTGFYGYYPKSISYQGWWSMWAYGCHQLDSKYKVIAWMPLPEPYKAESDDEYRELTEKLNSHDKELLDKIRAEIEFKSRIILKDTPNDDWTVKWNECIKEVLEIIDKYRESEDKE